MHNRPLIVTNIILTFVLIAMGAIVHSQSSVVECTSWPICYPAPGQSLGSVLASYPMIHRLLASIIIFVNTWLIWRSRQRNECKDSRKFLRIGLLLLIIQSILGALSAVYSFPTIMRVAHMFLSVAYILVFASALQPKVDTQKIDFNYDKSIKDWLALFSLLVFIQLFLGGVVNHAAASSVCGVGATASFLCTEFGMLAAWWPQQVGSRIHMLHRYNGVLIYIVAFVALFKALSFSYRLKSKEDQTFVKTIVYGILFLLLQNILVIKNIIINTADFAKVMHLLIAVIILVANFKLSDFFANFEKVHFAKLQRTFLRDALELTKLRLGALVLATVVSGMLISGQFVDFFYLLNALFLTTLIVTAATTLNCYMERDVDAKMERTKDRALPSGRLSANYALWQGIALIAVSIPLTAIYVNLHTAILGFIAFAVYLFAYTPMKQRSPFALYVGAIPGAIPPVMGRTIVVGEIDLIAIILFVVLFIWQIPHFMAISIYYNDDYEQGGIKVYSQFYSEKLMKTLIFILTVILFAASLAPSFFNLFQDSYLWSVIVINIAFVLVSIRGFLVKKNDEYIAWARQYFFGSIIYLPLLMAAMIFLS
jgi:protoheme IX farnesyltransferase